jgi:hypothetical protein
MLSRKGGAMGNMTRDETLAHAREIVAATELPVSRQSGELFWRQAGSRCRNHPPGG